MIAFWRVWTKWFVCRSWMPFSGRMTWVLQVGHDIDSELVGMWDFKHLKKRLKLLVGLWWDILDWTVEETYTLLDLLFTKCMETGEKLWCGMKVSVADATNKQWMYINGGFVHFQRRRRRREIDFRSWCQSEWTCWGRGLALGTTGWR